MAVSFVFLRPTTGMIALGLAALSLAGCNQYAASPYAQQQAPVTLSPQQQTAMAQQTQQYQQRAATLDRDNQELQSMLAQSRQQSQLLDEQIKATQTQLRDTTDRLTAMLERAIRTLMDWHIAIDEAMFLGGLEKGPFLREFEPDFYFDDQTRHVESAARHVPSGHVPHGIANE